MPGRAHKKSKCAQRAKLIHRKFLFFECLSDHKNFLLLDKLKVAVISKGFFNCCDICKVSYSNDIKQCLLCTAKLDYIYL